MEVIDIIEPENYQLECINNVLKAWKYGLPAIVTSGTGSGKTHISVEACRLWKADYVIVIGPLSSLAKWVQLLQIILPLENIFAVSPQAWISCGNQDYLKPSQPYTYKVNRNGKGFDFYPSSIWEEYCDKYRLVLVLDEFHYYQNKSQRTFAVAANTRYILTNQNQSRVILLSHTPCDTLNCTINYLYLLGIVCIDNNGNKRNAMVEYDRHNKQYKLTGLMEVLAYAKAIGTDVKAFVGEADEIIKQHGDTVHRLANELAIKIFLENIKDKITFSCVPDFYLDLRLKPNYANLFCKVSDVASCTINKIINRGIFGDEESEGEKEFEHIFNVERSGVVMRIITKINQALEAIKCDVYLELAIEFLESDPNCKVIIMVQYLAPLYRIFDSLKELGYNPAILEGSMSSKQREENIKAFQQHDNHCRVIVGTIYTGGVSIDLHDTSPGGQFPRTILLPPCPRAKDLSQATGRVFRHGITSRSNIFIIYTIDKQGEKSAESKIYFKIWSKTKVIKQFHAKDQDAQLPCDFPIRISNRLYSTAVDN